MLRKVKSTISGGLPQRDIEGLRIQGNVIREIHREIEWSTACETGISISAPG
jgi:hypothetical protein